MLENPKNFETFTIDKKEDSRRVRPLTTEEREELGLEEKSKEQKGKKSEWRVSPLLETSFQDPETGNRWEIKINFEEKISEFKKFYKDKFNLGINEEEIKNIWIKNYDEIRNEVEKYGYDSILIIPENLPSEADVNQKVVETMDEGVGRGKVATTEYWVDQQSVASIREGKHKIILVHSEQNIYDNPTANLYLKSTLEKNIMELSGLDQDEVERRVKTGQKLPVNFEIEINGQKIEIKSEGLSLEEYEIFQRVYFAKTGKHLDEDGWTWLLKSRSGSRVVRASWSPDARQLLVRANEASIRLGLLGLRLSRSFSS